MSFQDDVRKQIARNLDEQAAKQSEKERIEAERLTKMLDQANSCEYTFYGKCVEAAGEGKHELTMYVVDIMGTEYHRVGLITKEQGQQAIKSSAMCYDERDDEDFHRFAKALPKVVALKAADTIKEHLNQRGLPNVNTGLQPVYKWIHHPASFFQRFGWEEKTSEVVGYYIRITASW